MKYFSPSYILQSLLQVAVATSGFFGESKAAPLSLNSSPANHMLNREQITAGPCMELQDFQLCRFSTTSSKPWRKEIDQSCLKRRRLYYFSPYVEITRDEATIYTRYPEDLFKFYNLIERQYNMLDEESQEFIRLNEQDTSVMVKNGCPLSAVIRLISSGLFNGHIIKIDLNNTQSTENNSRGYFVASLPGGEQELKDALKFTLTVKDDSIADYLAQTQLDSIKKHGNGCALFYVKRGRINSVIPGDDVQAYNKNHKEIHFKKMRRPECYRESPFSSFKESSHYKSRYQPSKNIDLSTSNSTKTKIRWTISV